MTGASHAARGVPPLAPVVTVPAMAVLAAVALAIQWYAPPPAGLLWAVLWDLVMGLGLAAAGCAATAVDRRSAPGGLLLLTAAVLFGAAAVSAATPVLAEAGWVFAVLVTLPLALTRVVVPRPVPAVMRGFDVLFVLFGGTAAAARAAGSGVVLGLAATVAGAAVLAAGWVLFEATAGDDRRRVLWVVLGVVVTAPSTAILLIVLDDASGNRAVVVTVALSTVSLALPAASTVALVRPRLADVRDLIGQLAVLVVMFALTLAVYQGGEALARTVTGRPPGQWLRLALVLLVAAGFHPAMRWIRGSVDEMLFGGRADPVDTLARLGSRLAAGASPAEWLETLRRALAVPGVELHDSAGVLARAGDVAGGATVTTPLLAGAEQVGELVVGLPPEQLRPAPTTAAVLALVAPPLAQALHADALAGQLRASRGRVVAALEEER
ncbi:MAG TPA: hypothetical protein VHA75_10065, partial [Rugosimonospora sp.]|nr:hypothetical protein [Rugosimonospora sp.]